MTEVWHAKSEIKRTAIDPDVEAKINRLWHPGSSPIQLVDVHELITREAMKLLRDAIGRGWAKTKGNDAIHLVTARREGVHEFLTCDRAMEKWGPLLGFKVCAPHYEPEPRQPDLSNSPLFQESGRVLNLGEQSQPPKDPPQLPPPTPGGEQQ